MLSKYIPTFKNFLPLVIMYIFIFGIVLGIMYASKASKKSIIIVSCVLSGLFFLSCVNFVNKYLKKQEDNEIEESQLRMLNAKSNFTSYETY